jgi:CRP-like cAMP-binding protein
MKNEALYPLFDFLELFHNIPVTDAEIICRNIGFHIVKEGDILLKEGKIAKELFFICKGVLKIVTENEKGNRVTHFFLKENQFCTILNSFNNEVPSKESIEAACDTELIVFSKEKLLHLYNTISYLKDLIGNIIQQGLLDKIAIRNAYKGEDATTRYQKFLERQPDIALRVSLSDIASYLGITQQSLSRIRKNI